MQNLENYKKEKLTINLIWANIFSILIIIPTSIIFGLPFYFIWHHNIEYQLLDNILNHKFYLIIIILGIITHELIHGITWAIFTKKGIKSIKFGILWKMLTPYCHCKEPLTVKHYIIGAIMPAIILGILPSVIAISIGNLDILFFGIFFTVAAAGDFLIINLIRKENMCDLIKDHPSEAGCYIYRKIK